jgi:hypothetical protein
LKPMVAARPIAIFTISEPYLRPRQCSVRSVPLFVSLSPSRWRPRKRIGASSNRSRPECHGTRSKSALTQLADGPRSPSKWPQWRSKNPAVLQRHPGWARRLPPDKFRFVRPHTRWVWRRQPPDTPLPVLIAASQAGIIVDTLAFNVRRRSVFYERGSVGD